VKKNQTQNQTFDCQDVPISQTA